VQKWGEWNREQKKAAQAAAEPSPAEEPPAVEPPAAAEEPVPPEAIAPGGEEQPPAAEATPAEEDFTKEPEGLDLRGSLTAKDLNDRLKANPELDKLVRADSELHGMLFRNARLAAKAAPYEELFGVDGIEGAKTAVDNALRFTDLDAAFLGATTPQGVNAFMNKWADLATFRDEQGRPVLATDEQGRYIPVRDQQGRPLFQNGQPVYQTQMHPAFNKLIEQIALDRLNFLHARATADQDQELLDALGLLKARIAGAANPSDELPEHLKARAADIDRREQEITRRESTQQQEQQEQFINATGDAMDDAIVELVTPVLENAALTPFVREAAERKIWDQIGSSLESNRWFKQRAGELRDRRDAAGLKVLTKQQVQGIAPEIIRTVLKEAGTELVNKTTQRKETVRAQAEATRRTEPRATAGPARPATQTLSKEQLLAKAEQEFETENGRKATSADMADVVARFGRLNQAQRRALAG
jgi:hypothetical protein